MNRLTISVIVSTFNRADILDETLQSFVKLNTDGISARYIIVNNNSSDRTKNVVEKAAENIPIQYLFEPQPGKNCALNKALRECKLGEIVVFTDDDISPETDWLQQIAKSSVTFIQYSVFGGRIIPTLKNAGSPSWYKDSFIQSFAFAKHDLGAVEKEYTNENYPYGGNMWVRKTLLDHGFRFEESIGPRPKHRIMGSETKFLIALAKAGYTMLYYPQASVSHRIQTKEISAKAIRRRAIWLGRGEVHITGLPHPVLMKRSIFAWKLYVYLKLAYAALLWGLSWVEFSSVKRLRRSIDALRVMGNALESYSYSKQLESAKRFPGI